MGSISEVLKQHEPWLLLMAKRLCGNEPDAKDLVQDVLMKFITFFGDDFPQGDLQCKKWLSVTLQNSFKTSLRKKYVREGALADPTLVDSTNPEPPENSQPFYSITREEYDQALGCLTDKQRRVIDLSQQEKPQAEIAAELGIRTGAVSKRLFDARKRLREEFKRIIGGRGGGMKS